MPSDPPTSLVHVVLISFRDSASEAQRQAVFARHQGLGDRCGGVAAGILLWRVDWNLDQRKNWHLMELAVFRDEAALQRYRVHPAHVEMTAIFREIADWAVGDIEATLPPTGSESR
jgi:hypothetical protein